MVEHCCWFQKTPSSIVLLSDPKLMKLNEIFVMAYWLDKKNSHFYFYHQVMTVKLTEHQNEFWKFSFSNQIVLIFLKICQTFSFLVSLTLYFQYAYINWPHFFENIKDIGLKLLLSTVPTNGTAFGILLSSYPSDTIAIVPSSYQKLIFTLGSAFFHLTTQQQEEELPTHFIFSYWFP